jgi:uncharacterized DUF497 family protein
MRVTAIEWDENNQAHFAEHGRCSEQEVGDVVTSKCHRSRAVDIDRKAGDEPRRLIYGQTCSKRFLVVLVTPRGKGVIRPISCWPLSDKSQDRYLAWRRSLPK